MTLYRGYTQYTIDNLLYSNAEYIITILYRVAKALRPEMQWSEITTISVLTDKQIPNHSPTAFESSYELMPNNKVYIYWQRLDRQFWNGDDLKYEITHVQGPHTYVSIIAKPSTTRLSATVDENHANEFKIYSTNEIGKSLNYSIIKIRNEQDRIPFARRMVKFVENGLYTLKWYLPGNSTQYMSMIIVCDQIDDQQNVCQVELKI